MHSSFFVRLIVKVLVKVLSFESILFTGASWDVCLVKKLL